MMRDLKTYMYDTEYGKQLAGPTNILYGAEKLFIQLLEKSTFRTKNPEEAHFFLRPIRCAALRNAINNRWDAQKFAERTASSILEDIKIRYPYWDRSLGSDHFYVCAHDMGASVTASADPNLQKNAIAVVNTADYNDSFFVPHKDISMPPHPEHGEGSLPETGHGGWDHDPSTRTTLAFFAGQLQRGRVRPTLKKLWGSDPEMVILEGHMPHDKYFHHLITSKFCIIPRGYRAWTPRLIDAVWCGCVPVILSDHYHLPLQGLIDWTRLAITVPESKMSKLKEILLSVSPKKLEDLQTGLRQTYAHLTWSDPPRPYDAFHSVLYSLWKKRHIIRYKRD
eukprot:GHVT01027437.1.p1 GENE.GHVT01027437.1~~GHVT01027437.1.p1  ORF type:complete len:337 (+),score=15.99 GHVT01027437.1:462-1472(+)